MQFLGLLQVDLITSGYSSGRCATACWNSHGMSDSGRKDIDVCFYICMLDMIQDEIHIRIGFI